MATVKIDQLGAEIAQALSQYTEEVSKAIEAEIDTTAEALKEEIKAKSPVRTGSYKKGWKVKKESSKGTVTRTVYNKTDYQLTHLLEFGHVNRDGTRTHGKAHIGPAEDKYIKQLNKRIEQIIQNGG